MSSYCLILGHGDRSVGPLFRTYEPVPSDCYIIYFVAILFFYIFMLNVIPSWNIKCASIAILITFHQLSLPVKCYGCACVRILINGFLYGCKKILKTFKRTEVCTVRIPHRWADIDNILILVLHLYRPCTACAAYFPKVFQPNLFNLHYAILHFVFYEKMLGM